MFANPPFKLSLIAQADIAVVIWLIFQSFFEPFPLKSLREAILNGSKQ